MSFSILYLSNQDWSHEIQAYEAGEVPRHRLFGYLDLAEHGHRVSRCRLPQLFRGRPYRPALWRLYQALVAVWRQRRVDCLVAAHEASALPALCLKRLGLLRTPLVVLSVALLDPKNLTPRRRWLWRLLLPSADVVLTYCSAQLPWLREEFRLEARQLDFIPLGVDTDFFPPASHPPGDRFCLSAGTNIGKDFPTLLQALPEGLRLIVVTDPHNAGIIAAHRRPGQDVEVRTAVPIAELKQLYEEAAFIVIPLHESRMSSGQTVLLENMALGKVVVISDVSAVRDYVQGGGTALTVPAGDAAALAGTLGELRLRADVFVPIGRRAAEIVRADFSSRNFAARLGQVIARVVGRAA